MKNLMVTTLWNFIYNLKLSPDKFVGIKINHYLGNILCQLTAFPPTLLLEVQDIVEVLDLELGTQ